MTVLRPYITYRFCLMIRVMIPIAIPFVSSMLVTAKLTSSFFAGILRSRQECAIALIPFVSLTYTTPR